MEVGNYINGQFVRPQSGRYMDDKAPATGEMLAKIPDSNDKDVAAAVEAAKAAFPGWSNTPASVRSDWLMKLAGEVERRSEEFAVLESKDTGKPLQLCKNLDIPRAVSNLRFFASAILHTSTTCHENTDSVNYTNRMPVGVAGLITPWNLPLYLFTWKLAPALAAGNTVVCKPSEITPLTAFKLTQVAHDINFPAGVFNLVHGTGPHVGQPLVEHPDVRIISFTGGTSTGKQVATLAAPHLKKVSLELGGKNATIVFADCDFDAAVQGTVRGAFLNQGQICLCGSRVLIEESIYDKFVQAMLKQIALLKVGDPLDPNFDFGSLSSQEHREKVEYYVDLAKKEGGRIVCGGKRPSGGGLEKGAFFLPTLVTGLSPTSRCSREEIFGPVVVAHPFRTEEEALQIANNTQYGLAGSLWTTNLPRVHRMVRRWETGMVWVNTWLMRDLRVPFGGAKMSGIGRDGGELSLEFYSQDKNVCIKHSL